MSGAIFDLGSGYPAPQALSEGFAARYLSPSQLPADTRCWHIVLPDDPQVAAALNEILGILRSEAVWSGDNAKTMAGLISNTLEEDCSMPIVRLPKFIKTTPLVHTYDNGFYQNLLLNGNLGTAQFAAGYFTAGRIIDVTLSGAVNNSSANNVLADIQLVFGADTIQLLDGYQINAGSNHHFFSRFQISCVTDGTNGEIRYTGDFGIKRRNQSLYDAITSITQDNLKTFNTTLLWILAFNVRLRTSVGASISLYHATIDTYE